MTRPSHKELHSKLQAARGLVESGQWAAAEPAKLAANFMELDLYLREEQQEALKSALLEATPEDYAGARPPARSYEPLTRGAEMFAFAWKSDRYIPPAVAEETHDLHSMWKGEAQETEISRPR